MNTLQNQTPRLQPADSERVQSHDMPTSQSRPSPTSAPSQRDAGIGNAAVAHASMIGQGLPCSNPGNVQMSYGNLAVAHSLGAGPTAGQQAGASSMQTLLRSGMIRAKLTIGPPG